MQEKKAAEFTDIWNKLLNEAGKVIVGNRDALEAILTCLFSGGNCLLEGVPGLGKTLMVRTVASMLGLEFSRIQFTPDLMPADITGSCVIQENESGHRELIFREGPLFAQIILADEINRATPKTQSALLEAMQEHTVTAGGKTRKLSEPFIVIATQNPIEMEGTYPLPEAQLDRFMIKALLCPPGKDDLCSILSGTTGSEMNSVDEVMDAAEVCQWNKIVRDVLISPSVTEAAAAFVLASSPAQDEAEEMVKRFVRYGASPRAGQALILAAKVRALSMGRCHAGVDDLWPQAINVMRHRIVLNFEGEAEGISPDSILTKVMERVRRDFS